MHRLEDNSGNIITKINSVQLKSGNVRVKSTVSSPAKRPGGSGGSSQASSPGSKGRKGTGQRSPDYSHVPAKVNKQTEKQELTKQQLDSSLEQVTLITVSPKKDKSIEGNLSRIFEKINTAESRRFLSKFKSNITQKIRDDLNQKLLQSGSTRLNLKDIYTTKIMEFYDQTSKFKSDSIPKMNREASYKIFKPW